MTRTLSVLPSCPSHSPMSRRLRQRSESRSSIYTQFGVLSSKQATSESEIFIFYLSHFPLGLYYISLNDVSVFFCCYLESHFSFLNNSNKKNNIFSIKFDVKFLILGKILFFWLRQRIGKFANLHFTNKLNIFRAECHLKNNKK